MQDTIEIQKQKWGAVHHVIIHNRIAINGDRLAWEFFVFFSWFEYALKRNKRYMLPRYGDAKPNWDRYASGHKGQFSSVASESLVTAVKAAQYMPSRLSQISREHGVKVMAIHGQTLTSNVKRLRISPLTKTITQNTPPPKSS